MPIVDIESTALDFFALLLSARTGLGVTGDYDARFTIDPPTQIFRGRDSVVSDHFMKWDDQDRVLNWRHVDGLIVGTAGRDEFLSSWVDIVTDAQAGTQCGLNARDLDTALEPDD